MTRIIGNPDDLISAVRHLAESEAREIRRQAEEQADRIRQEGRKKADELRREKRRAADNKAREIARQRQTSTSRRETRMYLEAREALLKKVWDKAADALSAHTRDVDAYAATLRRLALAAAAVIGPGDRRIAADGAGHDLLSGERLEEWSAAASRQFQQKVRFQKADRPLDTWGGLILTDPDGKRRVDATFETLLAIAQDEVRQEVLSRLVTS